MQHYFRSIAHFLCYTTMSSDGGLGDGVSNMEVEVDTIKEEPVTCTEGLM